VVKLDPDGELVWSRIWQIPGNEIWSSGTAFGDGLLVVSGFIGRVDAEGLRMDKSSYLLGIDPDGDLRWQAAIGARPLESIESMAFAPDGTLIAVGQGEGAEQNVVALDGEWLDPGIAVTVTDLAATDLGLSWVEAVGTVGAAEGVPGGGTGADAFVMRLD
ncbi:MAG: hypothetical protein GWN07_21865, partial [Actinobacteria bacterium]|nr:hypothetical protein [Actinomycetota bacterium]NIS33122.1 hypothetical protein [Actinomycetota bacterium]NIU68042.1 hypothetical protein [Actinomycetota bacterium]NIW29831.1 hypothetical protein [Actinomycetota bacterium]NIX22332.1 hypothetical protein [Actinomycetota bacterium]